MFSTLEGRRTLISFSGLVLMSLSSLKPILHVCLLILIGVLIYLSLSSSSTGQADFPSKPVQVVVPYDPGGGTDTFARIIQKGIKDNDLMPQPLVIVNKPGGGTTIGSGYVKDARTDGYTMLCLHEAIITSYVTGQSPHGPDAFEPVGATGEVIQVILVPDDSPYATFEEFMAEAKANPETIKMGVTMSMPTHFTGLMLEDSAPGVRFRFVSSGGGAARLAALMGGHVDASFFSVSEYIRFKSNGLRPLATFGNQRHPGIPEVPTAIEVGFDVSNSNLQYWWFPKGTDPEIVDYMSNVLDQAMKTDYVRERLAELSILPQIIVGDELRERIQSRMTSFADMTIIERVKLPNVVAWTVGAILVFGVGVVRNQMRSGSKTATDNVVRDLRFDLVWKALGLVVGYVLFMAMGWLSFIWATLIFVLAACLTLVGFKKDKLLLVVELSLLMSFGVYFVFTQIFLVSLP